MSFDGEGDSVYAELELSLAVWEIIYIAAALLPLLTRMKTVNKTEKTSEKSDDRKADNNG